ncbi:response regulator [Roseisolibacter sp. H3M3-2]|uniref:response regulator n=1 Tax=Roseisolibacter sp. H3M3-2 TaxID=3031323 RepID=UPI0023DB48C2|nr:response regulator [Roseisolibacter sp. H3M3-2]MDF1505677.1 response regulator [Roseisolibacter sp. H3M3-2]
MKVLLAEDDPQVRERFAHVVAAAGHAVVVAGDGSEAWAAVSAERPDLVVLDVALPGMDGLALCRRIRATDDGHVTFVLAVTPHDGNAALAAVLDAGADDYIAEPIGAEQFAARLTIAERRIAAEGARRSAEAALARARYLAGVGEMSMTLQHEINNPLAALLGHAALIEQGLVEPGEEREVLAVVVEQAQRIAGVVKRLSAVRHPQSVEYLEGAWMLDLSREVDARPDPDPRGATRDDDRHPPP